MITVNSYHGFDPCDVDHITTYEVSSYCKPNIEYYKEILSKIGKSPEDCMMVGNDVDDDMCVQALNMPCYLITDCLINKKNQSIDHLIHGTMDEFYAFVLELPRLS